jgi:propanol-preferring alcohol dehydrogenase
MKAWQLTGADEPLQLVERDDPTPASGQVVVDVRAAGICHSDIGFMDGTLTALLPRLPMILGHEVAGVVAAVGADVVGVAEGDRVVIGGPETFAPGWSTDGGFATKCLADARGLIKLPDTVDFIQGATATDAGQTAYGAVMDVGQLQASERVGIIGLGGLGMTGARIAVLAGAAVYGAEPNRNAWNTASEFGVIEIVDDAKDLGKFNLDLIVYFAGFGTTTAAAISAVGLGGRVVQVGLGRTESTIPVAELVYKEVSLRGARGGHPGTIEAVLAHMATDDLTVAASTVGFDEIPDAIERLKRGEVVGRLVATLE